MKNYFISICVLFFALQAFARPLPPTFDNSSSTNQGSNHLASGTPVKLGFGTPKRTVNAGSCSLQVHVHTANSAGQIVAVTGPTTIDIAGSPATFYSDPTCQTAVTSMVIPTGGYRIIFYFSSSTAGTIPVTASSSGLTSVTQTETVTSAGSHYVSLAWTASASTDVAGYNVYRGTQSGGPYTEIGSTNSATTDYTDLSVMSGDTYYYVVTAFDSSNEQSPYSNQAAAVIP